MGEMFLKLLISSYKWFSLYLRWCAIRNNSYVLYVLCVFKNKMVVIRVWVMLYNITIFFLIILVQYFIGFTFYLFYIFYILKWQHWVSFFSFNFSFEFLLQPVSNGIKPIVVRIRIGVSEYIKKYRSKGPVVWSYWLSFSTIGYPRDFSPWILRELCNFPRWKSSYPALLIDKNWLRSFSINSKFIKSIDILKFVLCRSFFLYHHGKS